MTAEMTPAKAIDEAVCRVSRALEENLAGGPVAMGDLQIGPDELRHLREVDAPEWLLLRAERLSSLNGISSQAHPGDIPPGVRAGPDSDADRLRRLADTARALTIDSAEITELFDELQRRDKQPGPVGELARTSFDRARRLVEQLESTLRRSGAERAGGNEPLSDSFLSQLVEAQQAVSSLKNTLTRAIGSRRAAGT